MIGENATSTSRMGIVGRADMFDAVPTGSVDEFVAQTEGMTSLEEARFLYKLARDVTTGCIVEIGSYRGRSTVALARGSIDGSNVPVFAVEPHERFVGVLGAKFGPSDRGAFMRAVVETGSYHVIRLVNLSSEVVAPNWELKISLLWIDGDHRYEAVRRDWELWSPHLGENATIAFDDASNPDIGPARLLSEITVGQGFSLVQRFGKIAVLRRK